MLRFPIGFCKKSGRPFRQTANPNPKQRPRKNNLHCPGSRLLRQAETEEFVGIHWGIVDSHFIMQVRSGTPSAEPDKAERVAAMNALPGSYGKTGKVTIECGDAVAMIDQHSPSIAVH